MHANVRTNIDDADIFHNITNTAIFQTNINDVAFFQKINDDMLFFSLLFSQFKLSYET